VVALAGAILYGLGVFLASFSDHKLWWLYLSYGAIGGTGVGFSYIVPIAVLLKWFPDRRGLITGIAVGGFGAGALITAPLATSLIAQAGVLHTFATSESPISLSLLPGASSCRILQPGGSRKAGRPQLPTRRPSWHAI
jgi:MFS family permease